MLINHHLHKLHSWAEGFWEMFPSRRALGFVGYVSCPTLAINVVPVFLPCNSYRLQLSRRI